MSKMKVCVLESHFLMEIPGCLMKHASSTFPYFNPSPTPLYWLVINFYCYYPHLYLGLRNIAYASHSHRECEFPVPPSTCPAPAEGGDAVCSCRAARGASSALANSRLNHALVRSGQPGLKQ